MTATLDARLKALTQRVAEAETAVDDGTPIDLGGLEAAVDELCTEARALPREQALHLRPQLESLLGAIDRLAAATRTRLEALKGELREHGTRTQATRAYGATAARERPED